MFLAGLYFPRGRFFFPALNRVSLLIFPTFLKRYNAAAEGASVILVMRLHACRFKEYYDDNL
jgi:hypothetical protein